MMDSATLYKVLLPLLASFLTGATASESTAILDACKWKVEPLGCFADQMSDRTMPEQVLNERDPSSKVYGGRLINWKQYSTYLQEFICRCAEKAFNKGYKAIGIQFYGECWSGPLAHENYNRFSHSERCLNGAYQPCENDGPVCTGKDSTNFVYRIAPSNCDVAFSPIGCYKDTNVPPRPLPDYLMNERDYTVKNWNGHLINWKDWDKYSPEFLCRCAKATKKKGFTIFGAQFYGECWSGEKAEETMKKDGKSDKCIAAKFDKCPYNSFSCVGEDHANSLYRIVDLPAVKTPLGDNTKK